MKEGLIREIGGKSYSNKIRDPFGNPRIGYIGKVYDIIFGTTYRLHINSKPVGEPIPFLMGCARLEQIKRGRFIPMSRRTGVSTSDVHHVKDSIMETMYTQPRPYIIFDHNIDEYKTRLNTIATSSEKFDVVKEKKGNKLFMWPDESMGKIIDEVFSPIDAELMELYEGLCCPVLDVFFMAADA